MKKTKYTQPEAQQMYIILSEIHHQLRDKSYNKENNVLNIVERGWYIAIEKLLADMKNRIN